MGSNSFRLVVFQYEPGSWWSLADEIREATRVAAGMGDDGVLQPEPIDRAIHTAAVFASFLEAQGSSAWTPSPPAPSATPPTATSCWTRSGSVPGSRCA